MNNSKKILREEHGSTIKLFQTDTFQIYIINQIFKFITTKTKFNLDNYLFKYLLYV